MKLLLDQNLSRKLVQLLRDAYPESSHVSVVGLATATDREIWNYAAEHGYTIVSKDSDFRQLAFLVGAPPKAIWLRVGNVTTAEIVDVLLDHQDAIDAFDASEEAALLVLPSLPAQ